MGCGHFGEVLVVDCWAVLFGLFLCKGGMGSRIGLIDGISAFPRGDERYEILLVVNDGWILVEGIDGAAGPCFQV